MSSIKYEEVVIHVDRGDADKNNIQSSQLQNREKQQKSIHYEKIMKIVNCETCPSYFPTAQKHLFIFLDLTTVQSQQIISQKGDLFISQIHFLLNNLLTTIFFPL